MRKYCFGFFMGACLVLGSGRLFAQIHVEELSFPPDTNKTYIPVIDTADASNWKGHARWRGLDEIGFIRNVFVQDDSLCFVIATDTICVRDSVGAGTDTNLFTTDLTLTEGRTHDADGNDIRINNAYGRWLWDAGTDITGSYHKVLLPDSIESLLIDPSGNYAHFYLENVGAIPSIALNVETSGGDAGQVVILGSSVNIETSDSGGGARITLTKATGGAINIEAGDSIYVFDPLPRRGSLTDSVVTIDPSTKRLRLIDPSRLGGESAPPLDPIKVVYGNYEQDINFQYHAAQDSLYIAGKVTVIAPAGSNENILLGYPGNADRIVMSYDGDYYSIGLRTDDATIFRLHDNAPNYSAVIGSTGKFWLNQGSATGFAGLDFRQHSDDVSGGFFMRDAANDASYGIYINGSNDLTFWKSSVELFKFKSTGHFNAINYDATPLTGTPFGIMAHETDGDFISVDSVGLAEFVGLSTVRDSGIVVLANHEDLKIYCGDANKVFVTDSLWGGWFIKSVAAQTVDSALVVDGCGETVWNRVIDENLFWLTWWLPHIRDNDTTWEAGIQYFIDTISARYAEYGQGTLYIPFVDTANVSDTYYYWIDTAGVDPYDTVTARELYYSIELKSNVRIEMDRDATLKLLPGIVTNPDSTHRVNLFIADSLYNFSWSGGVIDGNAGNQFHEVPGYYGSFHHGNIIHLYDTAHVGGNRNISFADIALRNHSGHGFFTDTMQLVRLQDITQSGVYDSTAWNRINYAFIKECMGTLIDCAGFIHFPDSVVVDTFLHVRGYVRIDSLGDGVVKMIGIDTNNVVDTVRIGQGLTLVDGTLTATSTADADFFEAGGTHPNSIDDEMYHGTGAVHFNDATMAGSGQLNVVGAIDTYYPNISTRNTFIGYQAGNNPSMTGNQNVGIGSNALDALTSGANNVAIGTSAGTSITTGGGNFALGQQALLLNETGFNNVAIGFFALRANTAWGNIAIGSTALQSNTTGSPNVAVGEEALNANETGGDNIAIGYRALMLATSSWGTAIGANAASSVTTGLGNTMIGRSAGSSVTTGQYNLIAGANSGVGGSGSATDNVVLGHEAGFTLTGNGNVFLGAYAGYSETGSNKLYIENSTSTSPLMWGDFAANEIFVNGKLGYSTEGGSAITLAGRDGNEDFTDVGVGWGLDLTSGTLLADTSELVTQYDITQIDVDDADADPTNEIQALSASGTTTTYGVNLSLGGGTVNLIEGTNFTIDRTGNDLTLNAAAGATDADFFEVGGTSPPDAISDNIYKSSGTVHIGGSAAAAQTLQITGTARITGSTGTATTLAGRNASGDIAAVSAGVGLTMATNALNFDGLLISGDAGSVTWNTTGTIVGGLGLASSGSGTAMTLNLNLAELDIEAAPEGDEYLLVYDANESPTHERVLITNLPYLTAEVDGSITNEGILGVGAGSSNTSILTSNTSGAAGVTFSAGTASATAMAISEATSANGGTITYALNIAGLAEDAAPEGDELLVMYDVGSGAFESVNVNNVGGAGTPSGWTDDGAVVRLTTSTDAVGIGTASPLEDLHVSATNGGIRVQSTGTSSIADLGLYSDRTSNGQIGRITFVNGGNTYGQIGGSRNDNSPTLGRLFFSVGDGGGGTTILDLTTIDDAGTSREQMIVNASVKYRRTLLNGNTTLNQDHHVVYKTDTNAYTYTLPDANTVLGIEYRIVNTSTSNNITVALSDASDVIGTGSAGASISVTPGNSVILQAMVANFWAQY